MIQIKQSFAYPARIALVGMMGSGKTIISRYLAQKLKYQVIDTDKLIEQATDMSIAEIFALHGEEAFRRWEYECLSSITKQENCIVATGGGIILQKKNRDLLRNNYTVIWLQASVQVLWQRIHTTDRPFVSVNLQTLLPRLEIMLEERKEMYEQVADLVIQELVHEPIEQKVERILHLLSASCISS